MMVVTAPSITTNSSSGGGSDQCIVNDQMGPFTVLYILIFLCSLTGNLPSLWAFLRGCSANKNVNVYLVNLLVSDLLLTLALPFKIAKDLGAAPWGLMLFHCQASAVVIYISLYTSVFFLAFISIDSCLQVSHSAPFLRVLQEVGFARLMSAVVWLMLLLLMVPNMALPIQDVQVQPLLSCSSLKKGVGLHWHTMTVFLCMALFLNTSMAVLLSNGLVLKRLLRGGSDPESRRAARKAAIRVATVTAAYMVCFVPYHVVRTPYTLTQTRVITDCWAKRQLFVAKESTLLLAVLHICCDPLLYLCLCPSFRQRFAEAFGSRRDRADPESGTRFVEEPTHATE